MLKYTIIAIAIVTVLFFGGIAITQAAQGVWVACTSQSA